MADGHELSPFWHSGPTAHHHYSAGTIKHDDVVTETTRPNGSRALVVREARTGAPDTGVESESDALRLRHQLLRLKKSLADTDRVVVELIEDWQEALDECERCERRAIRLRREADEQELRLHEWRQTAAECFHQVSLKLSSEALNVHWHTAPFVAIEHQQALQLQCWLLDRRTWRPVRLAIGGGCLTYSWSRRSIFTQRPTRVQVSVDLDWIDEARGDGDVIVTTGCCGVEPRWQWTCLLGPAGREVCRRDALVFSCETEVCAAPTLPRPAALLSPLPPSTPVLLAPAPLPYSFGAVMF